MICVSSLEKYFCLVVFLGVLHLFSISYVVFNIVNYENNQASMQQNAMGQHKLKTQDGRATTPNAKPPGFSMTVSDVWVGGKRTCRNDIDRLSPHIPVHSDAVLQIDDTTIALVGGFIENYRKVSPHLQTFDISRQAWTTHAQLPDDVAETHQGIAYDKDQRILYIISGQKGSGCMPATTTCVRFFLETGQFEYLPNLPKARYSPGAEIVQDPATPSRRYLHAFGGADISRKVGAADHWRLAIGDSTNDSATQSQSQWEIMEPLPDSGVHGASFVSSDGYLHYTAYCQLDQGIVVNESMTMCHEHAVQSGQLLHHVADVGLAFRYPALNKYKDQSHWERVADMPFPACHGGSVYHQHSDTFFYIGGGLTNYQIKQGSAPKSLSMIQIYDAVAMEWRVVPFPDAPRGSHLFSLISWIDRKRHQLFSIHSGDLLLRANLSYSSIPKAVDSSALEHLAALHLQRTRNMGISAFQSCATANANGSTSMELHSALERLSGSSITDSLSLYEQNRGTWNEQHRQVQYPDIIAFPRTIQQVSILIHCAKQTGYRLCGRNGKHSYDGSSSCSRAIVVDISYMDDWERLDSSSTDTESTLIRLGAGMTLGKVAVALATIGLALPSGSCASVGVTGLTLSGGQGPLGRFHGMTCDHLKAVDLIDENGHFVHATDDNEFWDYLWLARGGGTVGYHFPGIITSLYFSKLVPISLPNVSSDGKGDETTPQRNMEATTVWTRARIRFPSNDTMAAEMLQTWHNFHLNENYDGSNILKRRLTIEPWIMTQFKRVGSQLRHMTPNATTWDTRVYLNVYFFGSKSLHLNYFLAKVLPHLQHNWTSVPGRVVLLERLDHLAFIRKLGGVRDNDQLADGKHGHDLNHQRWQGYSAVAKNMLFDSDSTPGIPLQKAIQSLVETIFHSEPKCRRYAEFKPLRGSIADEDSLHPSGAFGHRQATWMVLINHFYGDHEHITTNQASATERAILKASQHNHNQFVQLLKDANWYGGRYAGYVQNTYVPHHDLIEYHGKEIARKVVRIQRRRDPHNLFRRWLPNTIPSLLFLSQRHVLGGVCCGSALPNYVLLSH